MLLQLHTGSCKPQPVDGCTIRDSSKMANQHVSSCTYSEGAKCLKGGGVTLTRLTEGLSQAPHARVWWEGVRGPYLPQKKLNLGLVQMQFPAVLKGLLALFSLFLVDLLSRSQSSPTLFPTHPQSSLLLCKFGRMTGPIFSKNGDWGGTYPLTPPPVALSVCSVLLELSFTRRRIVTEV